MTPAQRSAWWQRWGSTVMQAAVWLVAGGIAYGGLQASLANQERADARRDSIVVAHEGRIDDLERCAAAQVETNEAILRELADLNSSVDDINAFLREAAGR